MSDEKEIKIGQVMGDKTVYAGISPETNKPMYTTPADEPLKMAFNEAKAYATKLDAHGHRDWRVPTDRELTVLFNNRAAIGGFDLSSSDRWSSTKDGGCYGRIVCMQYGSENSCYEGIKLLVRCVR